jgi:hypothetical protein
MRGCATLQFPWCIRMNVLLDDVCRPQVRTVIGVMLATAGTADFAVARVRLGAIDLTAAETGGVTRCRILLGRLDYSGIAQLGASPDEEPGGGSPRARLQRLAAFLESGRVEVRSAGMAEWLPDFSVYHGIPRNDGTDNTDSACIVGAHWFRTPPVHGPALTCVLREPAAALRAARRFEELWAHGHDVLPAVLHGIRRIIDDGAQQP